jgi:DNA mismatch endonuclease Vsr
VAFPGAKLAVFVDGDFWHGRNWRRLREKLATRFWYEKILGNIRRDRKVNRELGRLGWRVLRIWETEVERAPATFGDKIKGLVEGQGGTDTH